MGCGTSDMDHNVNSTRVRINVIEATSINLECSFSRSPSSSRRNSGLSLLAPSHSHAAKHKKAPKKAERAGSPVL
ncbi:hypothetical protein DPMN_015913 [Dreissena polymorpha]|uniref:Uncharacterized protein n=1 Tax=Dreissena polymorpha TaxID=45954 RepID=A0A9D4NCC4_DREPO|nr:hypothetical protein DPMN_015913 [Dreissena polymorpha]